MEELSADRKSTEPKTLRIGMTVPVSSEEYLVNEFSRKHPEIAITIVSADSSSFEKKVSENKLDLAIVRSCTLPEQLSYHLWVHSKSYLLASVDHPICKRAVLDQDTGTWIISPEDMNGYSYIFPSDKSFIRTDIESFFERNHLEYTVASTVDSLGSALWLTSTSSRLALSIGAFPHTDMYPNLRVFQIKDGPIYDLYLAYRRHNKTKVISSFILFSNQHRSSAPGAQ
jgi:DNA-binding transcriptional LysR family regulator